MMKHYQNKSQFIRVTATAFQKGRPAQMGRMDDGQQTNIRSSLLGAENVNSPLVNEVNQGDKNDLKGQNDPEYKRLRNANSKTEIKKSKFTTIEQALEAVHGHNTRQYQFQQKDLSSQMSSQNFQNHQVAAQVAANVGVTKWALDRKYSSSIKKNMTQISSLSNTIKLRQYDFGDCRENKDPLELLPNANSPIKNPRLDT